MHRLIIILTFFLFSCGTTSKLNDNNIIVSSNKDVLILSLLIRDHLRQTNGRQIVLSELLQKDTLKRISNNFQSAILKTHGGYISVYYKFSNSRQTISELTQKEKEVKWITWISKKLTGQYDGEIQFNYGERFYSIKKIVI